MGSETKIYGLRAILEALEAERSIAKIYLQKGAQGSLFKKLENKARQCNVNTSYVPVERLNRLTKNNHQGAVAVIAPISFYDIETAMEMIMANHQNPLFLLLDGVSDVRNFGAMIRTAECTGVNAIIIAKTGSAPVNEDTIKTSAGAAFNIPIVRTDHIKDAIYHLQAHQIKIIGASERAEKSIYEINFSGPTAILMGSEDKGISNSLLKLIDDQAKLPLLGTIGSLNVSVACGVFLYEVLRQRLG